MGGFGGLQLEQGDQLRLGLFVQILEAQVGFGPELVFVQRLAALIDRRRLAMVGAAVLKVSPT